MSSTRSAADEEIESLANSAAATFLDNLVDTILDESLGYVYNLDSELIKTVQGIPEIEIPNSEFDAIAAIWVADEMKRLTR